MINTDDPDQKMLLSAWDALGIQAYKYFRILIDREGGVRYG